MTRDEIITGIETEVTINRVLALSPADLDAFLLEVQAHYPHWDQCAWALTPRTEDDTRYLEWIAVHLTAIELGDGTISITWRDQDWQRHTTTAGSLRTAITKAMQELEEGQPC